MQTAKQKWPFHTQDERDAVSRVLASGQTNYWTGQECRQFEAEYADYFGLPHAIALMNGTVALEAALHALDIGPGDEVITSCRTFIASASSIVMRGAVPVTADVDPDSQNITADTIAPCITPRTKAVIVVHLAGWPADMPAILKLAKQQGLYVIEDCAQAHGAMIDNQYVGTFGDIGAFSFCQDKIITTGGEGGMVITANKTLWEKMWSLKEHGKNYQKINIVNPSPGFRWLHDSFGTNWRMTEMQSAIGRLQLTKLTQWVDTRRKHAAILTEYLSDLPAIRIPKPPGNIRHAFYKYYFFIRPGQLKPGWTRDRILEAALAKDIPCFTGSCSEIYLEEAFEKHHWRPAHRQSTAQALGESSLMLPVDPSFDSTALRRIGQALRSILEAAS